MDILYCVALSIFLAGLYAYVASFLWWCCR